MPISSKATARASAGSGDPYGASLLDGFAVVFFWTFFTEADIWLGRQTTATSLRPTVLFTVASLVLVVGISSRIGAPSAADRRRWLAGLPVLAPLAALSLLGIAGALHPTAFSAEGSKYALYPLLNLAAVLMGALLGTLPAFRDGSRLVHVGALLLLLGSILVDVAMPGTFAKHMSRATGFPRDPGAAALLVAVAAGMALDLRRWRARNAVLVFVAALGIMATLSRTGLLLLLATAVLAWLGPPRIRRRHRRRLAPAAMAIGLVGLAFAVGVVLERNDVGMFARTTTQQRLGKLVTADLVDADEPRIALLTEYARLIRQAPWLGHGSGFSFGEPKGPHNRLVLEWVNHGLAGLVAYTTFLLLAAALFQRRGCPRGVWLVAVLVIHGMLFHNVLEHRGLAIAVGVLLTTSAWAPPESGDASEMGP